jgi:hypothetical protein
MKQVLKIQKARSFTGFAFFVALFGRDFYEPSFRTRRGMNL